MKRKVVFFEAKLADTVPVSVNSLSAFEGKTFLGKGNGLIN